jgi:hypothetical protein
MLYPLHEKVRGWKGEGVGGGGSVGVERYRGQ